MTINVLKTAVTYAIAVINAPAGVVVGVGILAHDLGGFVASEVTKELNSKLNEFDRLYPTQNQWGQSY